MMETGEMIADRRYLLRCVIAFLFDREALQDSARHNGKLKPVCRSFELCLESGHWTLATAPEF
jgi:hypothetical protein